MILLEGLNISVNLGNKLRVENVSLSLESGRAVALIGPNGAGKTTLLRALAGLVPYSGTVRILGQDSAMMSPAQRASSLSYVSQTATPDFGFTSLEFVLMTLAARRPAFSLETSGDIEFALKCMDQMSVGHLASQDLRTLSSGEYQRMVMAQTLVSRTRIWLLDEPTSNLDLRHQYALLDSLRDFAGSDPQGGVLAVMHDLNAIRGVFDEVVLMSQGQIVSQGPCSDILVPEVLSSVFGVDLEQVGTEPDIVLVRSRSTKF